MAKIYIESTDTTITVSGPSSLLPLPGETIGTITCVLNTATATVSLAALSGAESEKVTVSLLNASTAYTYVADAVTGMVKVMSGATTVATLPVGADLTTTNVMFADGTAEITVNAAGTTATVGTPTGEGSGGAGDSFTLTTGANSVVGTTGNDTITGTNLTLTTNDAIIDSTTTDNDTMTVTGAAFASTIDTSVAGITIRNIENFNAVFDSLTASTLEADGIDTASTITVSQVRAGSGAAFTVNDVFAGSTVVAGSGVNDLTVNTELADASLTVNGNAATTAISATVTGTGNVTVTANSAASVTAVAATGIATIVSTDATTISATGKTINITATAATDITAVGVGSADAATISADGDVALTNTGVEEFTLSGNTAAVAFTLDAAADVTLTGSKAVTLAGDETIFDGTDITNTATAATRLDLTTVGTAADLTGIDVDVIEFSGSAAAATYTFADAATLEISTDVTGATDLDISDGTATDIEGSLNLILSADVNGAAITLNTTADTITDLNLSLTVAQTGLIVTGGTATVVATGSKALVLGASTATFFDASAMTGAVTASTGANILKVYSGSANDTLTVVGTASKVSSGAGNDTVNIGAVTLTSAAILDGQAGTDTLNITGGAVLTAGSISSFEYIDVNAQTVQFDDGQVGGQSLVIDGSGVVQVANINTTLDLSGLVFASTAATNIDFTARNDSTLGQAASLSITGSSNIDTITTAAGADSIVAGGGNDVIVSGDGADTVFGDAGNDTIDAGIGNDVIDGGAGDDNITGNTGNDTITAGAGSDEIIGGAGKDTIILTESASVADIIVISGTSDGSAAGAAAGTFTNYDIITGFTSGTDEIWGDSAYAFDGGAVVAVFDSAVVIASDDAVTAANDLVWADITDVDSVVAFILDSATYAHNVAAEVDLVAITFNGTTALYSVGGADATPAAADIKLIATIDADVVSGDFTV